MKYFMKNVLAVFVTLYYQVLHHTSALCLQEARVSVILDYETIYMKIILIHILYHRVNICCCNGITQCLHNVSKKTIWGLRSRLEGGGLKGHKMTWKMPAGDWIPPACRPPSNARRWRRQSWRSRPRGRCWTSGTGIWCKIYKVDWWKFPGVFSTMINVWKALENLNPMYYVPMP